MADKPFDREVINNLERPLSSDINEVSTYAAQSLVDTLYRLFATRSSVSSDVPNYQPPVGAAAFIGSGFKVRSNGAMQVALDAGIGFFNDNTKTTSIGSVSGVNDNELVKPLVLTATETINVPAADPSNPRIDIVEVQSGRQLTDSSSRDVFSPSAASFQPGSVNKTLTYAMNGRSSVNGAGPINYKTGTPAGAPVAPVADAGYAIIAQVYVPPAAAALGATSMMDMRRFMVPDGVLRVSGTLLANAAGKTVTIAELQAPAGVEVTAGAGLSGANWPACSVLIKAGDATQFRYDAGIFTNRRGRFAWSSVVNIDSLGTGVTAPGSCEAVVATAAAADTVFAISGGPGFPMMVGQPTLSPQQTFSAGVSGRSMIAFDLQVQY